MWRAPPDNKTSYKMFISNHLVWSVASLAGTFKKRYIQLAALWSGKSKSCYWSIKFLFILYNYIFFLMGKKNEITENWNTFFQECHTKLLWSEVSQLLESLFVFLNQSDPRLQETMLQYCGESLKRITTAVTTKRKIDNYSA